MEKSVVICFIVCTLIGWESWLVYNYVIFCKQLKRELEETYLNSSIAYWKNRVTRVQNCIKDLVDAIHKQFPKSTIKYNGTDEVDAVEGEIKY